MSFIKLFGLEKFTLMVWPKWEKVYGSEKARKAICERIGNLNSRTFLNMLRDEIHPFTEAEIPACEPN